MSRSAPACRWRGRSRRRRRWRPGGCGGSRRIRRTGGYDSGPSGPGSPPRTPRAVIGADPGAEAVIPSEPNERAARRLRPRRSASGFCANSARATRRSCRSPRRRWRWPRSSGRASGSAAIASISPLLARDVGRHAGAGGGLDGRVPGAQRDHPAEARLQRRRADLRRLQNANLMRVVDRRKGPAGRARHPLSARRAGPGLGQRSASPFPAIS